jgi:hypothetical protein
MARLMTYERKSRGMLLKEGGSSSMANGVLFHITQILDRA